MVDFKVEDIDLYIPRNLSNEKEYHAKVLSATKLYEALKLRNTLSSPSQSSMDAEKEPDTVHMNGSTDTASPSSSSETKFFLPTNQKSATETTQTVFVDSPLESPEMANGQEGSTTDLSSYLKDLSLSSPGAACSDNETVFSDDYTAMTDVGEGSELGDPKIVSKDNSFSSDIDSTYSELSNSCDISNVTALTDANPINIEDNKATSNDGEESPRGKNKPNIKLLLGKTPPELEDWSDTPSCSQTTSPESPRRESITDECNFYEDREFDFLRTEPVKRSTSLKTYKTPPGTPGRKKGVRFADALGLDLESVRHILNLDEPPKVPASAMKDLKHGMEEEKKSEGLRYLSANFPQPGASATFFQRVQGQKVLLENCVIDDKQLTITGTVRVANIAYHKKVIVRYSVNNWLTHTDIQANYVQNSNDGPTDRFSFSISVPSYFSVGARLQFCISFRAGTDEYWDSNYGGNYIVECYAKNTPLGDKDNAWIHFL